jgi:hypothetical protein
MRAKYEEEEKMKLKSYGREMSLAPSRPAPIGVFKIAPLPQPPSTDFITSALFLQLPNRKHPVQD